MTIDELYALCTEALQRKAEHPEWSHGKVQIVVHRQWTTQRRMKLLPLKGAPYGEPVVGDQDGTVVVFDAQEVLDWLEKALERKKGVNK